MANYFDCLRCGAVTEVFTTVPLCGKCGSSTGVIAKGPQGAMVTKTLRNASGTDISSDPQRPADAPELRVEPRLSVDRHGTLISGEISAPCVIQNMCTRGFLIKYPKNLPLERVLQLRCELYFEQFFECIVQVRHINREYLGARVIEINDHGRFLCERFLDERRAANLNE